MATIYDIAAEAKVSIATVSRAINNPSKLAPDTLARVKAVLEKNIPVTMYFGDYIDNGPEDIMSTSFWRRVRDGALAFAAQYNADGGDCTVVDLPKIGITGNSHFMFQELNNKEIADHIYQWLESRALA